MSLKSKAIRGISWSLADKLINQMGYLAVTIYLARLIGPESFGLIGMLTIFILLAESAVNNGFSQALVQRSKGMTEEDASTTFYINIGWGLLMYAGLYISAPWIAEFYREPELVEISRVLFLVVIIHSLVVVVRAKLIVDIDFKSQAIASTAATLLSSALAVVMANDGYGYWSLVWLVVLKAMFHSVGLWLFCRWCPKLIFSNGSFISLFKFGSNLMLAGIVATIVNNLYIALIGRYYSATQVGYFSQATNLSNYLMQFVASSLQGVTYPIMTSIKEDRKRLIRIYKQVISVTMLVSLPMLVGFASIAKEFVLLLLGEEWLPAVPVLIALCIARTITPISAINMNLLNAVGRSDLFLKVDLVKLPMTVGALLVAIPYGIVAVSWAMVCTSFAAFFINAFYPGRLFNFGGFSQLRVAYKYVIATLLMYLSVQLIELDSVGLTLIAKVVVGAAVYAAVLMMLRDSLVKRLKDEVTGHIKFHYFNSR